jgi:hypothetical protein
VNHSKVLILISKYARCSTSFDEEETWIRELPLLVLIYEGEPRTIASNRPSRIDHKVCFQELLQVFFPNNSSREKAPMILLNGNQFAELAPRADQAAAFAPHLEGAGPLPLIRRGGGSDLQSYISNVGGRVCALAVALTFLSTNVKTVHLKTPILRSIACATSLIRR